MNDDVRRSGSWRAIDRPNIYEAPSLSWASFPGAITYEYAQQALQNSGREHKQQDLVTHVVEVHTIPEGLDPKGRLAGGFLRLRGSCRWFMDHYGEVPLRFKSLKSRSEVSGEAESSVGTHSILSDYNTWERSNGKCWR